MPHFTRTCEQDFQDTYSPSLGVANHSQEGAIHSFPAERPGLRLGGAHSNPGRFMLACKLPQWVTKVTVWWSQRRTWGQPKVLLHSLPEVLPHPGSCFSNCWMSKQQPFKPPVPVCCFRGPLGQPSQMDSFASLTASFATVSTSAMTDTDDLLFCCVFLWIF